MKSRPSNVRKALAERFWGIFDNLAADMIKGVIGLLIAGVVFLYLFAAWLIPWVVVSLLGLAWLIDHTYQARRTKEQVRELENILARMTSLGLTYLNLMKPVAAVDIDRPYKASLDDRIGEVVEVFLASAVQVLGDEHSRASVLRPAPLFTEDKVELGFWKHHNLPRESRYTRQFQNGKPIEKPRRFEVGNPDKEGVAGFAVRVGQTQRAVLKYDKGLWTCTHSSYVFRKKNNQEPDYRAFVAIPLISAEDERFGVLCFDSMDETRFDGQEVMDILENMGDALSAALAIYSKLVSRS